MYKILESWYETFRKFIVERPRPLGRKKKVRIISQHFHKIVDDGD